VRKRNARGDRRHPHSSQIDENPPGQVAGDAPRSRSSVQTVHGTLKETMPDPVPKPPGRPPADPSSSRIHPDHRRGRKLTGLQIKRKKPKLRCHPRSSPKCLRFLDRGNRQPSTVVTESPSRENILRDDGTRGVRIRAEGLASLVAEFRQRGTHTAKAA
jgi:hypothetical protein